MRTLRNRERGAALIEAAIVIPILLIVVMGVVDIGRLLTTSAKVQEASQEGALFASYAPGDHVDTRDRVLDSLGDFAIDATSVSIVCAAGDAINVTITHDVELLTPWISNLMGSTVTVTGQAVGQNFTNDTCDPTP